MAANFGFSVGGFIALIGMIQKSVKALSETKGASVEFQSLLGQLESLKEGIRAIENLKLDILVLSQNTAIRLAVRRCQNCMNGFMSEVAKDQSWLAPESKGVRANLMKIK